MSPERPHRPESSPELVGHFGRILERYPGLEQRKMFGYPAAFVAAGHMATGLHGSNWIVRLSHEDATELRGRGGQDFEPMPGRPMRGFVSLPSEILADDDAIDEWIARARRYAESLPPKKPRKKRPRKKKA